MNSREKQVKQLLKQLALGPEHLGYHYLVDAICMVADDIRNLQGFTYKVYNGIANKYKTSYSAVERAMRNSISIAYTNAPIDMVRSLFCNVVSVNKDVPTVKCFVAVLAEYICDNE